MFALLIPTALAILPLARAEWEWTAGQTAWVVVVSVIGSFIILSIIGTCIRSAYLANKMAEQFQQYRPPPPLQQNVYSTDPYNPNTTFAYTAQPNAAYPPPPPPAAGVPGKTGPPIYSPV
ncbi:hypothetical protein A1Q2_01087 [Trichosporon asahii var. asahii CBS 8904]|uniref:Uncharacterized protein n=1 Tax=Trichosporon asahii var. asahii (strain CBS 8904) TaxID=1220162 RepID=K1VYM8_TRIAC|nr:hypothetical protein A1Q2_01087 [Trichosporon asahii var. asahii CBS 8904]